MSQIHLACLDNISQQTERELSFDSIQNVKVKALQTFFALARKETQKTLFCQCQSHPRKWVRIVVRRYGPYYYLARHPGTATDHHQECYFYRPPIPVGAQFTAENIVQTYEIKRNPRNSITLDRQGLKITKLNFSFSRTVTQPFDGAPCSITYRHHAHRKQATSVSLIGLLNIIISNAHFNKWHYDKNQLSTKITPASFLGRIEHSLQRRPIKIGARDIRNLLIYPHFNANERTMNAMRNAINSRRSNKVKSHLVLFQMLPPRNNETVDEALSFVHVAKAIGHSPYYAHQSGFKQKPFYSLITRYENHIVLNKYKPKALHLMLNRLNLNQDAKDSPIKIIALARAESYKNDDGSISNNIIDIALIYTNKAYIPIDSSHEGEMADRLIDNNIKFTKPLLFEPVSPDLERQRVLDGECDYIPDFIVPRLHNPGLGKDVLIEVYGVNTPKYRQHQREKSEFYRNHGLQSGYAYLEWRANDHEAMPALTLKNFNQ